MKHGVLAVDKPEGISSARVVALVKKALGAKKAGHTGTLDPFATGLMLCGINKGTRISRFLLGGPKTYKAEICLGVVTDTLDCTGQVEAEAAPEKMQSLTRESILEAVAGFEGLQQQVPPVYSALKHKGQPLYKLARQGRSVTKPPREITIFSLEVQEIRLPYFSVLVRCSAGTYIRSLARDIGDVLDCGGHLSALRRTESCGVTIESALPLSSVMEMTPSEAEEQVIPMADLLTWMPGVTADGDLYRTLSFGQPIGPGDIDIDIDTLDNGFLKVLDHSGDMAAILEFDKIKNRYNYCCVFIE